MEQQSLVPNHGTWQVLVVGGSGLIGTALIRQLIENPAYSTIYLLVRKPLSNAHPKLVQIISNFQDIASDVEPYSFHHVFCALGTTRKKTKDWSVYHRIDVEYPIQIAMIAQKKGSVFFGLVSAIGADVHSSFKYTRFKAEAELGVCNTGIASVFCFRPSLLLGDRTEFRLGEQIGQWIYAILDPLFVGKWRKMRAISVEKVANAMILCAAQKELKGNYIIESDQIEGLSDGKIITSGLQPISKS